jgi:hypothetical protein
MIFGTNAKQKKKKTSRNVVGFKSRCIALGTIKDLVWRKVFVFQKCLNSAVCLQKCTKTIKDKKREGGTQKYAKDNCKLHPKAKWKRTYSVHA